MGITSHRPYGTVKSNWISTQDSGLYESSILGESNLPTVEQASIPTKNGYLSFSWFGQAKNTELFC